MKWSASPVIITFSSTFTMITDLPFPAVTICNMNRAQISGVRQIDENSDEYSMVHSLCTRNLNNNITLHESTKWRTFRKVLLQVSQPCSDMLVWCSYGGIEFDCLDIFSSILTDDGLCCIFNGVRRKFLMKNFNVLNHSREYNITDPMSYITNDWTPEKGFLSEKLKKNPYSSPRPAAGNPRTKYNFSNI